MQTPDKEFSRWIVKWALYEGLALALAIGVWLRYFQDKIHMLFALTLPAMAISATILVRKLMSLTPPESAMDDLSRNDHGPD
ncbi:MAG: hypothetical protein ACWA5T_01355 [Parvularcula sp.]